MVLTEGSQGGHPLPEPDRRALSGARGRRRRAPATQRGGHHSADPDVTGAGPGRTDRRLSPAVPCSGPRSGQRAVQPVDQGFPGRGPHDQFLPRPDGGVDQHTRRPRSADRTSDREPEHRRWARSATKVPSSPKPSTRCRSYSEHWPAESRTSATELRTPTRPQVRSAICLRRHAPR